MSRPLAAAALLLVFSLAGRSAFCQEADKGALAPFASRLKASVSESQVKLTWKDSPDVSGEYLVYRSTEEVTSATLGSAQLVARVASGVEYCVDTPPDQHDYFYAVIIEGPAGKLYNAVIPFRNTTTAAVSVTTTATEEEQASRVEDVKAALSPGGDTIILSFKSSNLSRDLIAFWGTSPLRSAEDLLRGTSKIPLDPGTTSLPVTAIPGVDYYFAVLDAGLYKVGQTPLEPGVNATEKPTQIPLRTVGVSLPSVRERRVLPLPALQLTRAVESGRSLPEGGSGVMAKKTDVSPATERAIAEILSGLPASSRTEPAPRVLDSDATPAGGEAVTFQQIVTRYFAKGSFAEAASLLEGYMSLPRKPEMRARVRFYLGQISFFQGRTREALMEFLLAEDYLYHETAPWLDACYARLEADDPDLR